jgi:voltage-gated potassium channel
MSNTPAKRATALRESIKPFDIFLLALSLLSIVNLILIFVIDNQSIRYVVETIDYVFSLFFVVDFITRFINAPAKGHYLFRQYGWADFLSSLPLPHFKILRVLRLVKAWGIIRRSGGRKVVHDFLQNRAASALYLVLLLIILLLEFGSVGVLYAEQANPDANIQTAVDAMWWTYVTITTVGYGDHFPTTIIGRIIGVMVMLVGVGLFAVVTGYIANKFLPNEKSHEAELQEIRREVREIKELITRNSNK